MSFATTVAVGMDLRLEMSALAGRIVGLTSVGAGLYGIVQKAADSAHRLDFIYPSYYAALYIRELEIMYFLIEPLFERAGA